MTEDELSTIFLLDVSRTQTARYVVRASASPHGLFLEHGELASPVTAPTWGRTECRSRLELWHRNLTQGARFFGCYAEHRLMGFVLISQILEDKTIELYSIFVDASQRRAGVGSLLLRKAEEVALASSAGVLHLSTTLDNASAIDFYLHHGYQIAQLTDRSIVPKQNPEIRMAKTLRA